MKYRTRIQYTETDKALMWERWRQGESLNKIALLFDRHHSAIGGILSRNGGIRPLPRHRCERALALAEREEISRGVIAGLSVRALARSMRRAPSTVSREIPVAGECTGRARPSRRPGIGRGGRSAVNWHRTARWQVWWPRSCGLSGHPTRWPGGSSTRTRRMKLARCPTRPSTARCSFRRAEP